MLRIIGSVFLCLLCLGGNAQWDQYFATWEGKPGGVVLNMNWIEIAPVNELPFVLITQQDFHFSCRSDGFPTDLIIERTETVSEQMLSIIQNEFYGEVVGYFTHDCVKKDYFYLPDTTNVRAHLKTDAELSKYLEIQILSDPEWKIYKLFLYPDPYLKESMINKRALDELAETGMNLEKSILLVHTARFSDEESRKKFRLFLLEQGFKILEEQFNGGLEKRYQMRFSRKNMATLNTLNEITVRLVYEASNLDGQYEGWEVELKD